ncbi:MAG: hypothetical protein KAT34_22440, partial [Candidatus Aminicenantes bacterium]|nr:hypothetical protein [Candidatus Aminicenantes bacterium]
MSLVEAHEKRVSRVKMFIHMIIIGALIALALYCLFFFIQFKTVNKKFIDLGFPRTTLVNYFQNKYFKIPLSSFKLFTLKTHIEPFYQKLVRRRSISAAGYNLFIEDF